MVFFDGNSEMLAQLKRIADSLGAPHDSPWTEWLKTLTSFIAGICTAYIADWLRNRSTENKEQFRLRRIVYNELVGCFLQVHSMVSQVRSGRTRFNVLQSISPFDGEVYMKQNPAVFYGLPEAQTLSVLYCKFRDVCRVERDKPRKFGMVEMKSPLGYFSDCYRSNRIFRKNLKKILTSTDFSALDDAVKHYKWSFTFEEMAESGLMEIIDKPSQ